MPTPTILIKRFDLELPLPEYKTDGAAAFDLSARTETVVPAGGVAYVPLNVAIKLPNRHVALLFARSSLHKKGLIPANAVGVIDEDYCGDTDEIQAALQNFSQQDVTVARGDRVMQVVVLPVDRFQLLAVDSLSEKSRGGFGTTGDK